MITKKAWAHRYHFWFTSIRFIHTYTTSPTITHWLTLTADMVMLLHGLLFLFFFHLMPFIFCLSASLYDSPFNTLFVRNFSAFVLFKSHPTLSIISLIDPLLLWTFLKVRVGNSFLLGRLPPHNLPPHILWIHKTDTTKRSSHLI